MDLEKIYQNFILEFAFNRIRKAILIEFFFVCCEVYARIFKYFTRL